MSNLSYKTYSDLALDIKQNIHKIPEIDLVVGIPRSGMIPAYMIGLSLSKPVCSINEFLSGNFMSSGNSTERISFNSSVQNVLILDDSINTGNAINKVKSMVENAGAHNQYDIKYGAVYYKKGTETLVDIALTEVPQPRMFEWNFLNHSNLKNAAFDIDGVLCVDPTPQQNDDGDKYIDFILNAQPLYIPQYRVAAIVTSRLEKYRSYTEKWLEKHGVLYDKLYMLGGVTAQERAKACRI